MLKNDSTMISDVPVNKVVTVYSVVGELFGLSLNDRQCLVLYDSFTCGLPFHYILFFLLGRMMSLLLLNTDHTQRVWFSMLE